MKIVCAFEDSPQARKALAHAAKLCSQLKSYELLVLNVIALTKVSSFPFLDQLEGGMNIQVEEQAEQSEPQLEQLIGEIAKPAEYSFVQIEGNGTAGSVFADYLFEFQPDLVIVGSTRKMPLES